MKGHIHSSCIYMAAITDERFSDLGIHKGYKLTIDPSATPKAGDKIAWIIDEEGTPVLELGLFPGSPASILGVVTACDLPIVPEFLPLEGFVTVENINGGTPIPVYSCNDRPDGINSLEGWNRRAREQNRRSFKIVFGREPVSDDEVEAWARGGFQT